VPKLPVEQSEEEMEERTINGIGYIAGGWPPDSAKSTIVFIHGAGGSSAFWQAQVHGLAERANAVAVDLPGHGRSGKSGKNKIEDYARVVAEFMRKANLPKPIPCGLSMGGAITQQLLLDYRDQVRAGILIGTGARLKVAPFIFEGIKNDYSGFVDMIGKFAASKKTDPKLIQPFKEETARCNPGVTLGDFQACNDFDVMERLSSIDVPVLVVTAEDDMLTPPKYGEALEKGIKHASRVHIPEAGHIVPMEKHDEINRAIREFLDNLGL
jgi:pimeloyl-ACP methyl ester carboxylesterase